MNKAHGNIDSSDTKKTFSLAAAQLLKRAAERSVTIQNKAKFTILASRSMFVSIVWRLLVFNVLQQLHLHRPLWFISCIQCEAYCDLEKHREAVGSGVAARGQPGRYAYAQFSHPDALTVFLYFSSSSFFKKIKFIY